MNDRSGFLIAVEGIDGAGKTTLARALAESFVRSDVPVTLSKEPTSGPWGTRIRESAATGRLSVEEELHLLVLDRRQHVDELILPALARDEVVILDRYFPSSVAYQGAAGLPVGQVMTANDFAPAPDVTLLLDVEPATGLERIRTRGDAPNHFETVEALAVARRIFQSMPLPSKISIDAGQGVDLVLRDCKKALLVALADKARARYAMTPRAAEYVRMMGAAVVA